MLLAQRLDKIKRLLLEKKSIDNTELSQMLGVSEVTIRKDLIRLEEEGFLQKIHGGAILSDAQDSTGLVEITDLSAKMDLSRMALDLIDYGDSLFIGSGTTCRVFARLLREKKNIRVVTNDFFVALELKDYVKHIFFLGGQIESDVESVYTTGGAEFDFLTNVFVNRSFFSVDGIDIQAGLTLNNYYAMRLLQQIKQKTKHIALLVDSTKFDRVAIHQLGPLDFIDCIITDRKVDDKYKETFFGKDIKLISALDY
ncbi:MAG: DeoR/GlpR family DNA-binding transcription regulator [Sphaerochaetaceae bacterium]|nr:DeoR/GlpR family DNA-binding transcription regulator [Sphaerochaetaceae bacterium]